MDPIIGGAMISAGAGAAGQIIGNLQAKGNDTRQLKQNQRLLEQQVREQKNLTDYNMMKQMEMWENTNYKAQREQMEKAGLNVGLMYGGSGAGGATTNVNTGNVQGTSATGITGENMMGLQLGLQAAMQQAQIELTKAQTKKTEIEAAKTAGIDTELITNQIQQIKQGITSSEIQNKLTEALTEQQNIQNKYTGEQAEKGIQLLQDQHNLIIQQLRSAQAQGDFDEKTLPDRIKQQALITTQGQLNLALTQAGIDKTQIETKEAQAKINKIAEEIINMQELREQGNQKLANEKQQLIYNSIDTEFRSGRGAKSVRGFNTIINGIGTILHGTK